MPRCLLVLLPALLALNVAADDDRLDALRSQLSKCEAKTTELQRDNAKLRARIAELQQENRALRSKLEKAAARVDDDDDGQRVKQLEARNRELEVLAGIRSPQERQQLQQQRIHVVETDDGGAIESEWTTLQLIDGVRADYYMMLRAARHPDADHIEVIIKTSLAPVSLRREKAATVTAGDANVSLEVADVDSHRKVSGTKKRITRYTENITLRADLEAAEQIGEAGEATLQIGRSTLRLSGDDTALFRAFAARLQGE